MRVFAYRAFELESIFPERLTGRNVHLLSGRFKLLVYLALYANRHTASELLSCSPGGLSQPALIGTKETDTSRNKSRNVISISMIRLRVVAGLMFPSFAEIKRSVFIIIFPRWTGRSGQPRWFDEELPLSSLSRRPPRPAPPRRPQPPPVAPPWPK